MFSLMTTQGVASKFKKKAKGSVVIRFYFHEFTFKIFGIIQF